MIFKKQKNNTELNKIEEELVKICEDILQSNISEDIKGTAWYNAEKFLIRSIISLAFLEKKKFKFTSLKTLEEVSEYISKLPENHISKINFGYFMNFKDKVTLVTAYNLFCKGLQDYKEFIEYLESNRYKDQKGNKLDIKTRKIINLTQKILM